MKKIFRPINIKDRNKPDKKKKTKQYFSDNNKVEPNNKKQVK